jgi:hypothetical protein
MRRVKHGEPSDETAPRRAAASLPFKEEGCRSAVFGTIMHGHHLLVGGIARRGG